MVTAYLVRYDNVKNAVMQCGGDVSMSRPGNMASERQFVAEGGNL